MLDRLFRCPPPADSPLRVAIEIMRDRLDGAQRAADGARRFAEEARKQVDWSLRKAAEHDAEAESLKAALALLTAAEQGASS